MGDASNGSVAGISDGGVTVGTKVGAGHNAITRAVHKARGSVTQAWASTDFSQGFSFSSSLSPSFTSTSFADSIQGASSSWNDPNYTIQDWHSDLQAWGWEDKPVVGSGYMH